MEDGSKIRIDAESRVAGFGEEEEVVEEEVTEEVVEELAEESVAEETDWAKTFEEMKDRVAELEKAVFGEKAEEDTEDLSTEVLGEVITRMNSIEEKFSALNDTASNEGVNITPASSEENKIDLQPKVRLSRQEKVRELINKYN